MNPGFRRLIILLLAGASGAFASRNGRSSHDLGQTLARGVDVRRPTTGEPQARWDALSARVAESPVFGQVFNEDVAPAVAAAPVQEVPRLPALVLRGIVGGPPWLAIVDSGMTAGMSVVLQQGDLFAGARVQAISRTSVTVRRRDSVLTLSLADTWR